MIWPNNKCECSGRGIQSEVAGIVVYRLAAIVVAVCLASSAAPAQQADEGFDVDDWPCHQKYRPVLAASSVWPGPDVGEAVGDWRGDEAVRALAERVASPEMSPSQGEAEIERFAASLVRDKAARLTLLFAALLDEINGYRRFAIDGIWEFTAKHRLLAEVLAKTEAAYLAVPYDGTAESDAERKRIEEQRFWQLRAYDDAEDEARYLCKRLMYLEGKMGTLARAIAKKLSY